MSGGRTRFALIGERDHRIDGRDQDWLAFSDRRFFPFYSSHFLHRSGIRQYHSQEEGSGEGAHKLVRERWRNVKF